MICQAFVLTKLFKNRICRARSQPSTRPHSVKPKHKACGQTGKNGTYILSSSICACLKGCVGVLYQYLPAVPSYLASFFLSNTVDHPRYPSLAPRVANFVDIFRRTWAGDVSGFASKPRDVRRPIGQKLHTHSVGSSEKNCFGCLL